MRGGWIAIAAALAVGCSSSSDGSSSSEDSSTPIDSSTDETAIDSSTSETSNEVATDAPGESSTETGDASDSGACNALPVPTTTLDEVQVASSAPTMTGGTIADGTYELTTQEKYTGTGGASGPDGIKVAQTLVFSGGTSIQSVATAFGATARWNASYTAGGTDLAVKATCGSVGGDPALFKYSATSTGLQIFVESQSILETFTLK